MPFNKILIIGTGLIGGSLVKAIRRQMPSASVDAAVRNPSKAEAVKPYVNQLIDTSSIKDHNYDLAIICTPVEQIVEYAVQLDRILNRHALITDVGSTKQELCAALQNINRFIGSHPMAGSEKTGFEYADETLFQGRMTVVCKDSRTDTAMHEKLCLFWQNLGSRVIVKTSEEHDRIVAYTSHFPHLLSYLFAGLGEQDKLQLDGIYGNSFLDFTRIANSDIGLWTQIFSSNRKNILSLIDNFIKFLGDFKESFERNQTDRVKILLQQSTIFLNKVQKTK